MTHLLIALLFLDSALVFLGLLSRVNMQPFIVLYWLVLMLKNLCDLRASRRRSSL